MLGEIRLGFFADGLGYHRDCSRLLYKVDSSSDLSAFKEGRIIEVDADLYKIQAVELGFIPYPGRRGCEREKPIKLIYVSRAKVELLSDKRKKAAINVKEVPELKGIADNAVIIDDKEYSPANFEADFPELVEKPKKKRKSKLRGQTKHVVMLDQASFIKEDKIKPKAKLKRTRVVKKAPKSGTVTPKVAKEAVKKIKKTKTKKEKVEKCSRRKRCPKCTKLFKSLGRHKCKK